MKKFGQYTFFLKDWSIYIFFLKIGQYTYTFSLK